MTQLQRYDSRDQILNSLVTDYLGKTVGILHGLELQRVQKNRTLIVY